MCLTTRLAWRDKLSGEPPVRNSLAAVFHTGIVLSQFPPPSCRSGILVESLPLRVS